MRGKLFFLATMAIALVLLAQTAVAATGNINRINRPEKHGTITRTDDSSNACYQFRIPQDVAPGYNPAVGDRVTFDAQGRKATNVAKEGTGGGGG